MNRIAHLTPEPIETLLLMSASIDIFASSSEGIEHMTLEIDGREAQTWENISKDGGIYSYESSDDVSADQIRIRFGNAIFEEDEIDTNLFVDRIDIDDVSYETEDASTFSTGTRTSAGIIPGFWMSERLDEAGYFQFDSPDAVGSVIDVIAGGVDGGETFNISLNGQIIRTFTVSDSLSTYSVVVGDVFDPSTDVIRIEHVRSPFAREGTVDSLQVDKIIVDNRVFEAEAPTTLLNGVASQSEWIVGEGYLAFGNVFPTDSPENSNPETNSETSSEFRPDPDSVSVIPLQGNSTNTNQEHELMNNAARSNPINIEPIEQMLLMSATIEIDAMGAEGGENMVVEIDGVEVGNFNVGTSMQTYDIQLDSDVTADQVRIRFTNDVYSPDDGIDCEPDRRSDSHRQWRWPGHLSNRKH